MTPGSLLRGLKRKQLLTAFCLLLLGAATASAGGYPAAFLDTESGIPIVVVGKFDPASFTAAEADTLSSAIAGLSGSSAVLTTSELAALGFSDADLLKDYVYGNYRDWFGSSALYLFFDIRRTAGIYGHNIRIDAWLADGAVFLGLSGDYLYLGSVEFPELYISLASPLLRFD